MDVFPKNTTVGDVMFRELDNFKESYNCGDILLVYMADITRTQVIASTISNLSVAPGDFNYAK
jgi:hypothetical protein